MQAIKHVKPIDHIPLSFLFGVVSHRAFKETSLLTGFYTNPKVLASRVI